MAVHQASIKGTLNSLEQYVGRSPSPFGDVNTHAVRSHCSLLYDITPACKVYNPIWHIPALAKEMQMYRAS